MFKTVGLMARQRTQSVMDAVNLVINYLASLNVPTIIEQETLNVITNCRLPAMSRQELGKHCNLLIVIGGDGSLLSAARGAAKQNLPVVGINLGTLGFLTDIRLDSIHKIGEILNDKYNEEERFLLKIRVQNKSEQELIGEDIALNDMVMTAVGTGKMIDFALHIDDQLVCSYRADGVIISTPTGSTAHALAGGGPILRPSVDALAIVPMFSHNLSSRPIVINATSTLKLTPTIKNHQPIKIICDGQNELIIPVAGEVVVKKAQEKLRLIHPTDYDYFESLRVKLGWES